MTPNINLTKVEFTSNSTWTAPSNVYWIMISAFGGGGGACGSETNDVGGCGGNAAQLQNAFIPVVPGTTYNITIGAGGAGSAGTPNGTFPANGAAGSPTTFDTLFSAAGGGIVNYACQLQSFLGGAGIGGQLSGLAGANGNNNTNIGGVYSGGTGGTATAGYVGGGGGGAGPRGNGGNGGNGNATVGVQNGVSGAANSGAGGGGAAVSTVTNANGGNGGSGWLAVYY